MQSSYARTIPLHLEFADTIPKREIGLMHRENVIEGYGMLFIFPAPQQLSFWMYGTLVDLSIAFLNEEGVIGEIQEMKSYPHLKDQAFFAQQSIKSTFNAKYALEMSRHWFTRNGIRPGDRVFWNLDTGTGYISTKDN